MSNLFTKQELLSLLALEIESYSSQPKLPAGWQLVGLIQTDPAVTAKLLALQDSVHLPFLKAVFTPDDSPWGFVAYDPATGTAYICIRGTESKLEWALDGLCVLTTCENGKNWMLPASARVHEGFQLVFSAIRASVASLIEQARDLKPSGWFLQGHSLGCPLSNFSRLLLTPGDVVRSCIWAAPRTGNGIFSGYWNSITPHCMSIVSQFDLVPKLPPPILDFGDIQTVLRIHGGGGFFDPKTAHNLELGYKVGIQGLTA